MFTFKRPKPGQFVFSGILIVVAVVCLDQYTKWQVMETMLRVKGDAVPFADWLMTPRAPEFFLAGGDYDRELVLTPFLNFVMVWNKGVSFGLFDNGAPVMQWVLSGLALAASTVMAIWMFFAHDRLTALSLSLIIGGALGNVIDRVRFTAVADFVDVHAFGYHWPAFNLADSCIVVGAVLLILDAVIRPRRKTLFTG